MMVTASKLRQNIYQLLDWVLETGEVLEIERKGRVLQIAPRPEQPRPSGLSGLRKRPTIQGDPEELVHQDWSNEWKPSI